MILKPATVNKKKVKVFFFILTATIILVYQLALCLFQIANYWQWGHNGYNGAAYQVAARNTIRHRIIWPAQYHTAPTKPRPDEYYTHAPLGLHLATTASLYIFGNNELSVRTVPALFSLLSAIMLLILTLKFFSAAESLIATFIYVFLPINSIYCNMTNHCTGCIFFALVMFYGYLNWIQSGKNRHLIICGAGAIGATLFDWPGYTLSVCLAIYSLYRSVRTNQNKKNIIFITRQLYFSIGLMVFALISFAGYMKLISIATGLNDVVSSITARSQTANLIQVLKNLYGTAITTMFPLVIRVSALMWILITFAKHVAGRFAPRDIVAVSFFIAGIVHFVLFPNASAIHYYWNWQFNPFVSIACAQLLCWTASFLGENTPVKPNFKLYLKPAYWLILLSLFTFSFVPQAFATFREGRKVAGSFDIPQYKREYKKILFAVVVNRATSPQTGVAIHTGLKHRIEFESYLDRAWSDINDLQIEHPEKYLDPNRKWVLIGDKNNINQKILITFMKHHPYIQVGNFFLTKLYTNEQNIKVYEFKPVRPPPGWKFFITPFDSPYQLVRLKNIEERYINFLSELPLETRQIKNKITPLKLIPPVFIKSFPLKKNK